MTESQTEEGLGERLGRVWRNTEEGRENDLGTDRGGLGERLKRVGRTT